MEQRLRQRTRSQGQRVRFFHLLRIFDIGFANLLKLERCVRWGSVSVYNSSGIEVSPKNPNPVTLSSNPSLSAAFFEHIFFQIGLATCSFLLGWLYAFKSNTDT